MKIGLDASSLPVNVAGAGKYVCGLIQGLAQIDARNEYVIFVKFGTQNSFAELPDNFRIFPLPNFSRPSRLFWQHWAAGSEGRQCRLDIWHGLHYSLPHFHEPMRTVSTFHDVAFFLHPELYPAVKRLYFQQTIRRAWNVADAVISVSRSTANEARRWFGEKPDSAPRRLHIVLSGLEERFFSMPVPEKIARVRSRYALSAPYILFVGTLEKRKNLPLLIAAFRRLRDLGYRDLLLVLAGLPSNGQADVEKAIAREKLNDAVRCLGYVPEADILPLYHGAQLFVLPSMHEGFGFPLLEAMACGVPALAANNSAMRELAADQDMLCFGAAEVWAGKMEQLLFNTKLRQKLIGRGLKQAREFSWQQTAWATLQVYKSVYASAKKRLQPTTEKKMLPRHGVASPAENIFVRNRKNAAINDAVLKTLAYADLFDYPLRLEEVHGGLLECDAALNEVSDALQEWERRGVIEEHGGLYFLRDRRQLVAVREQRRQQTHALLQKHAWLLRLLVKFPGVRSVSLSGAAAFENCQKTDDLDVFIITAPRRLWSVYVALVILLKLLGKRQTICLNCLFDQEHLRLNERDFFVAHQIAFLRPCSGGEYFRQFLLANAWIYSHLPQRRRAAATLMIAPRGRFKKIVENIFLWQIFDYLEKALFALYRRRIQFKTAHLADDGVVILPGQIRLFTNNHRHRIKDALQRRVQEISQHDFLSPEVEASHVVF